MQYNLQVHFPCYQTLNMFLPERTVSDSLPNKDVLQ